MESNTATTSLGLPINPLATEGRLSPYARAVLQGGSAWRVVQEHTGDDERSLNRVLQTDVSRGVAGLRLQLDRRVDWSLLSVGLDLSCVSVSLSGGPTPGWPTPSTQTGRLRLRPQTVSGT